MDEMEKPFEALLSEAIDHVPVASNVVVLGNGFGSLSFLQPAKIIIKRNKYALYAVWHLIVCMVI